MGRIVIVLFALSLFACSPSFLLKRSERLKKRAIERGAKIERDTVWRTTPVFIKGPSATFPLLLKPSFIGQTRYVLKDTIMWRNKIKVEIRDNYINVECPDSTATIRTPTVINENVSAGYTWWDLVKAGIFGTVLGALAVVLARIVGKR